MAPTIKAKSIKQFNNKKILINNHSKFLMYRVIETGQPLKLHYELTSDRWKNRTVTWLDWSPHVNI
jgi:hypothetical protein